MGRMGRKGGGKSAPEPTGRVWVPRGQAAEDPHEDAEAPRPEDGHKGRAKGSARRPPPTPLDNFSEGDVVSGVVSGVTEWGAFVNFGSEKDALLPKGRGSDGLAAGDPVEGLLIASIDLERRRVSLRDPAHAPVGSGRGKGQARPGAKPLSELAVGEEVEGKVNTITAHGVFVDIGAEKDGFLPWRNASVSEEDVKVRAVMSNLCIQAVDAQMCRITLRGPISIGASGNAWGHWNPQELQNSFQESAWEDEHQSGVEEPGSGWSKESRWSQNGWAKASWRDESAGGRDSAAGWWHGQAGAHPAAPSSAVAAVDSRSQLISAVFRRFDADGDGRLSSAEMREFACCTGFDGSDADWAEEFRLLCRGVVDSQGIDEATFHHLINDDSDEGCYCTDEELRDMLTQPPADQEHQNSLQKSALEEPGSGWSNDPRWSQQAWTKGSWNDHSAGGWDPSAAWWQDRADQSALEWEGEAADASASSSRSQLISAVFRHFDSDRDGRLSNAEMRKFACSTGFDGSDTDWAEEFRMLCKGIDDTQTGCSHLQGIDEAAFHRLVNDDSEDGCHCTDEELQEMIKHATADEEQVPLPAQKVPPLSGRAALKAEAFRTLDTRGTGYLGQSELRVFAQHTGFSGSDDEWAQEYQMLCQDSGVAPALGLDEETWSRLVDDDESDAGCHCSDEELAKLIRQQHASSPPSAVDAGTAQSDVPVSAPKAMTPEEIAAMSREQLKAAVFAVFDKDADGRLDRRETLSFAREVEFDGSEQEWAQEFSMLCGEFGVDAQQGIHWDAFSALVDDDSDSGLHMPDSELAAILTREAPAPLPASSARPSPAAAASQTAATSPAPPPGLLPVGAASHAKPEEPGPRGRDQLKQALFRRLDVDRDARLLSTELLPFVLQTGFDGATEEWEEEYTLLCKDMGLDAAAGLSESDFSRMLDDDSAQGCFCDDEELRAVLARLPEPEPTAHTSAARGRPPMTDRPSALVAARPSAAKAGAEQPIPADPWGAAAQDPWSAAVQDPWAAPAAKAAAKGKKGEKGKGKGKSKTKDTAEESPVADSRNAEDDNWGKWRDSGKLGPEHDPSKPALNATKLLEASRAAIAARKAREEAEAEEAAADIAAAALRSAGAEDGADDAADDNGDAEFWEMKAPSTRAESSTRAVSHLPARAPKAASMTESFGHISAAICRLATGESRAAGDLVRSVMGAPSTAHALAVASSAIRSILHGRFGEAQTLLAVDELLFIPVSGETSVLLALGELASCLGTQAAPFLNKAMLPALVKVDDKNRSVRSAAEGATREIVCCNSRFAFEVFLPSLIAALDLKRSPVMKIHAMRLLTECWRGSDGEAAVSQRLPQLLPAIIALLVDTTSEVRSVAVDTAEVLFDLCGNRDLQPFYGEILACAKGSKDVSVCVRDLAEVVFVQQVEASALAVVLPVLMKGLRSRNMRTQRQACVIAKNMCELVSAVADVTPFTPQLLPQLQRISEDASDPDVRAVAGRAHGSLAQAADVDIAGSVRGEMRGVVQEAFDHADLKTGGQGDVLVPCPAPVRAVILDYVVLLGVCLGRCGLSDKGAWGKHLLPLLEPLLSVADARQLVGKVHEIGSRLSSLVAESVGSSSLAHATSEGHATPEANLLCNCSFTLACGAATLLVNAHLRLERGRVYGLVGGNDSGKSTILRAIHDRRVSNFPPVKEVVTALVEHGVGERQPDCDRTPSEYLLADEMIQALRLTRQDVTKALVDAGFQQEGRMQRPIRTLSGGWRMKLGIARAMLQNADVLLLDEPTGHLDVAHIRWLVDYVNDLRSDSSRSVTTLVVSHDTRFLDQVCTDIIHVEGGKLHTHVGNFSKFILAVPDARLGAGPTEEAEAPLAAFVLPEPGPLEGVRSRGRRFLNLEEVFFSYERGGLPVIRGASVECCLRSRVAIVGPNGAGKSTLAGLVVGELAPDRGLAWRHPALRMAYVAQQSFHHLERHMDLTATQYILWRFEGSEDREAMEMRADEAEAADPKPYRLEASRLVPCGPEQEELAVRPDVIVDRRQRGRLGYEYEVRLQGHQETIWVPRAQLAAMGSLGMAKREDERQAAQRSLSERPLTTPGVEAHLGGFGLESEEASHRRLGALSHGQRARAVLAAATWLAPHLLVLDEPTNYLDGPALKALVAGLQGFGGGVLVISHTASFLDEVCSERWHMRDGVLRREGALVEDAPNEDEAAGPTAAQRPAARPATRASAARPGTAAGAGGASGAGFEANLEAAKAAAKEQREKKRLKRIKELRRKNGEQVSSSDDEWYQDLLKKANARPKIMGS